MKDAREKSMNNQEMMSEAAEMAAAIFNFHIKILNFNVQFNSHFTLLEMELYILQLAERTKEQ